MESDHLPGCVKFFLLIIWVITPNVGAVLTFVLFLNRPDANDTEIIGGIIASVIVYIVLLIVPVLFKVHIDIYLENKREEQKEFCRKQQLEETGLVDDTKSSDKFFEIYEAIRAIRLVDQFLCKFPITPTRSVGSAAPDPLKENTDLIIYAVDGNIRLIKCLEHAYTECQLPESAERTAGYKCCDFCRSLCKLDFLPNSVKEQDLCDILCYVYADEFFNRCHIINSCHDALIVMNADEIPNWQYYTSADVEKRYKDLLCSISQRKPNGANLNQLIEDTYIRFSSTFDNATVSAKKNIQQMYFDMNKKDSKWFKGAFECLNQMITNLMEIRNLLLQSAKYIDNIQWDNFYNEYRSRRSCIKSCVIEISKFIESSYQSKDVLFLSTKEDYVLWKRILAAKTKIIQTNLIPIEKQ